MCHVFKLNKNIAIQSQKIFTACTNTSLYISKSRLYSRKIRSLREMRSASTMPIDKIGTPASLFGSHRYQNMFLSIKHADGRNKCTALDMADRYRCNYRRPIMTLESTEVVFAFLLYIRQDSCFWSRLITSGYDLIV